MRLYYFPVAPNPTKVRLYLSEKASAGGAIPLDDEVVSLPEGEHRSEAHRRRSPFGKVPALELDDGSFLHESLAIIEYLEERFPEPPLIGTTPEERARVRQLERIAELRGLVPLARLVHATRSPLGLPPNPAVAASAREGLPASLSYLDEELSDGRAFLAGERPTIADCTLAAGLQFARFGEVVGDLLEETPHLRRWDAAYRARPEAEGILIR